MKKMIRMFAGMMVLCMLATLIPAAALAGEESGNPPGNTYDNAYEESEGLDGGGYAAIVGDDATHYATALEAIAAAKDGDTIVISGRVLWGGDAQTDNLLEGTVTITGMSEDAALVVNGANGRDEAPNVTHLVSGVIFENLTIEESAGVNYLYAQGNYLELSNVNFLYNDSVVSGELAGAYWIFIGGSDLRDVARTEMVIGEHDADVSSVIGGGVGKNVIGDTNVTLNGSLSAGMVFGGGVQSDVGGKATVVANVSVTNLWGGSYRGHVGSTDVTANAAVPISSVYGGSKLGHVEGDAVVTIGATGVVGGSVYGGCSDSGGNPWNGNWRGEFDLPLRAIAASETYVGGDTYVTIEGETESAVYGGGDTPVEGSTYVTVNGTVNGQLNAEGVFGGGNGDGAYIGGDTHVTIGAEANIPMVKSVWQGRETLLGGAVFGGGRFDSTVKGDTHVTLNGPVGTEEYGGLVFGSGYGSTQRVLGTAHITVNVAPYPYTSGENRGWQQYVKYPFLQNLSGVYGAGFNGAHNEQGAVITIHTDMGDVPVFGDGLAGAAAQGGAEIRVMEHGGVGSVWGWKNEEGLDRSLTGTASVIFDGSTGAVTQIVNADEVQVANASDVTIDKDGVDNEQLVNVTNLTVAGKSKLTLPASAHILGNYTGAERENKGTLVLSAGKRLTADGTIVNLTDISIVDVGDIKPAEAQVYVTSGAGSTTTEGDFTWIDRRAGLAMEWKDNGDGTSQWWLVKYEEPEEPPVRPGVSRYTLTVRYLDENGEALASAYTTRQEAGTRYDLTAQTEQEIEGYTIASVEGDVVGTVQEKVVVTVYYTAIESELPQEPETEIPEEEVPLAPTPELPEEEEIVIEEPETPLGNLPQTGSVDPSLTLGAAALALSLAMAGLALGLRKKEE